MSRDSYLTWLSTSGLFDDSSIANLAFELEMYAQEFATKNELPHGRSSTVQVSGVSLSDFKSVQAAELQLGPLTVVVGRNSSGKSSLIQSLLLAAQHLTNQYSSDRKLSLNQHLVRLGTFAQLHRHGADSSSTSVGVRCGNGTEWSVDLVADEAGPMSRNASVSSMTGQFQMGSTSFAFELDHISNPDVAYPVVFPGRLPAHKHEVVAATYKIENLHSKQSVVFSYALLPDSGNFQKHPLPLEEMDLLTVVAHLLIEHSRSSADVSEHAGLIHRHKADLSKFLTAMLTEVLSQVQQDSTEPLIRTLNEAIDLDIESFDELALFVHSFAFAFSIDDVLQKVSSDAHFRIDRLKALLAATDVGTMRSLLWDVWRGRHFTVEPPTVLVPVGLGGRYPDLPRVNYEMLMYRSSLADVFRNVYHVGPIRDPESMADPISDPLYVGSKGEHTMEVLQRENTRRVMDPLTGQNMPFAKALASALRNLQLADDARIEDRGRERPGISMTPYHEDGDGRSSENESAELNAVGVGVSQVLPVVMQCLLAQPGQSLVIVEQPELHLHPRLEQTLADFFLACVRSGRQIIIETHSEHLVNRLRLRIAEDMTDEVSSLVKVVFAEQRDGVTTYREPSIDNYGSAQTGESAEDWPEGFLDLTLDEARRLLQAANERRIREIEARRAAIEDRHRNRSVVDDLDDDDED